VSIPGFMPTCGIDPETFGLQPSTTETQGTLSAIIFPFVTERSTEGKATAFKPLGSLRLCGGKPYY